MCRLAGDTLQALSLLQEKGLRIQGALKPAESTLGSEPPPILVHVPSISGEFRCLPPSRISPEFNTRMLLHLPWVNLSCKERLTGQRPGALWRSKAGSFGACLRMCEVYLLINVCMCVAQFGVRLACVVVYNWVPRLWGRRT